MGLSGDDEEGVSLIREAMNGSIPPDLDTFFNLRRWWRGWKVGEIAPRLEAYIENREAAGYADPDFLSTFHERPEVQHWIPFFSISCLRNIRYDSGNRSIVLVQRMEGMDYEGLMRTMTATDFLHMQFAICEYLLQLILAKEAETGVQWGIAALVDFTSVSNLADFCNPSSAVNRIGKLCTNLLQEWYCDVLHKMVIFNPPSLVGLLWRMAKLVLNENTYKKIAVAQAMPDLHSHFHPETLPLTDSSTQGNNIFSLPPPRTPGDQRRKLSVWTGVNPPPMSVVYVKPRSSSTVLLSVSAKDRLLWRFIANTEIAYALHGPDGSLLRPRFSVATFKLPEEGELLLEEGGKVTLTFTNSTSLIFSAQIHCAFISIPSK